MDQDPIYKLNFTNENHLAKFFGFVIQGFITYAGFPCEVSVEQFLEKNKYRIEYIVSFDEVVFDSEKK